MKSLNYDIEQDSMAMKRAYSLLVGIGNVREARLLQLGCNLPFKPSELLLLRSRQMVTNGHKEFFIRQQDDLRILAVANRAVQEVFEAYAEDCYLFSSRHSADDKPITRQAVSSVLRNLEGCGGVSISGLRKVWGRRYLHETGDLSSLRVCFNHASKAVTMSYLGLSGEPPKPIEPKKIIGVHEMRVSALFLGEAQ